MPARPGRRRAILDPVSETPRRRHALSEMHILLLLDSLGSATPSTEIPTDAQAQAAPVPDSADLPRRDVRLRAHARGVGH